MKIKSHNLVFLFAISILIINVFQAYYTGLFSDEAYYWRYSIEPDWGYFDHPPMVAWLIYAGTFICASSSELAIRILFVFLNSFTILLLYNITKPHKPIHFIIILPSVFLLMTGGFLATPDVPLLFFTTTTLYFYKKFIDKESFQNILLLAISCSLLLYSKYHGGLVIALIVISNLKLLTKPTFYLVACFSIISYLPHIFWFWAHDWAPIKYHFFERSTKAYSYIFTLEYLFSQPFILAALNGFLFLFFSIKIKAASNFERTLKFILFGFLGFFLAMSFKGKTEAHWTAISIIPLIYFSLKYLENAKMALKRLVIILSSLSFAFIILIRIYLIEDIIPVIANYKPETYQNKEWAQKIKENSKGLPVVFMNSYQRASKYHYYSGIESFSLNNVMGRRNQYNFWNTEEKIQHKKVFLIINWDEPNFDFFEIDEKRYYFTIIENFRSFSKIYFQLESKIISGEASSILPIKVLIKNNSTTNHPDCDGSADLKNQTFISYQFFKNNILYEERTSDILLTCALINENSFQLPIQLPSEAGKYILKISLKTDWFPPLINSDNIPVVVI